MARGKKTEVEREYDKLRRNLQQKVRRMEKRGYIFNDAEPIPRKPKKVTQASIRKLKSITSESLIKKAVAVTEDGEVIKGSQFRAIEKQRAKDKRKETIRRKREQVETPSAGELIFYNMVQQFGELYSQSGVSEASDMIEELYDIREQYVQEDNLKAFYGVIERNEKYISDNMEALMTYLATDASARAMKAWSRIREMLTGQKMSKEEYDDLARRMGVI